MKFEGKPNSISQELFIKKTVMEKKRNKKPERHIETNSKMTGIISLW